jgi:hypothetical protein
VTVPASARERRVDIGRLPLLAPLQRLETGLDGLEVALGSCGDQRAAGAALGGALGGGGSAGGEAGLKANGQGWLDDGFMTGLASPRLQRTTTEGLVGGPTIWANRADQWVDFEGSF